MERVHSDRAPAPVGPYSQAVSHAGLVFASGQIPLDPRTGTRIEGDIEAQTERVIANLAAVLEAAGSGLDKVLKCTVFLADFAEFAAMNEVYAKYFVAPFPARSTVQVARLPRDVRLEIEVVAVLD